MGQLTVAAAGRLFLPQHVRPGQCRFARGRRVATPPLLGPSRNIAMPAGKPVTGLGCSFGKDAILRPRAERPPLV